MVRSSLGERKMTNSIHVVGDKDASARPLFLETLRERLFHGAAMVEINETRAVATGVLSAGLVCLAQMALGKDFAVDSYAISTMGAIVGIGVYNFAKGFLQNKISFDETEGEAVVGDRYSAPSADLGTELSPDIELIPAFFRRKP